MARPKYIPGSTIVLPIKNRNGKQPLSQYLAARLGMVTEWALDLLRDNRVRLNNQPAGPDDSINLSAGPHTLEITFPDAWPRHMAATAMPLDILYEDNALIVLNKPAGRVVHPARGHLDNQTLQNGLRYRYRDRLGQDGVTIGPPHRLDKDTSGVIVFALTTPVYIHLVSQFSTGTPHKRYIAVADGVAKFDTLSCEYPLGPDAEHKGRGTLLPVEQGGKTARTDFTVLERGAGWTLVEAIPHTGRPHQIRIHAASLGLPLAGDIEYNPQPGRLPFTRQALHAAGLTFVHPVTGESMTTEAPLAGDLAEGLEQLRGLGGEVPGIFCH